MSNQIVNFEYKMISEDHQYKTGGHGTMEFDIEKFKKIEKIAFEWGYSITDLIAFFVENLNEDSAEQLLSTMDHCIERE